MACPQSRHAVRGNIHGIAPDPYPRTDLTAPVMGMDRNATCDRTNRAFLSGRKLAQIIDAESLFYPGHFVHHLFKTVLAEKFVLLFLKILSQRVKFMRRHNF